MCFAAAVIDAQMDAPDDSELETLWRQMTLEQRQEFLRQALAIVAERRFDRVFIARPALA